MQPWTIEKIQQERQEEERIQLPLSAPEPSVPRKPELTPAPERGTSSVDFELKL